MNLDTRATVDTFLVNFDLEGVRDGSSHDWITDVEARQLQGYDKKGNPGPLNGRLKDATAPAVLDVPEAGAHCCRDRVQRTA